MAQVLTMAELKEAISAAERMVEIASHDPDSGFATDAATVLRALQLERVSRVEWLNETAREILAFAEGDPELWAHFKATRPELIARLREQIGRAER